MEQRNLDTMRAFDEDHLPDLDVAVLGALELFSQESMPELNLDMFKRPLVVGSVNAAAVGRILFETHNPSFVFSMGRLFGKKWSS